MKLRTWIVLSIGPSGISLLKGSMAAVTIHPFSFRISTLTTGRESSSTSAAERQQLITSQPTEHTAAICGIPCTRRNICICVVATAGCCGAPIVGGLVSGAKTCMVIAGIEGIDTANLLALYGLRRENTEITQRENSVIAHQPQN